MDQLEGVDRRRFQQTVLTVGLLRCSPAEGLSRASALVFAVDQVGGARAVTVVMRGAPQRSTGEQAQYEGLPVNYRIFSIVLCINMIRCPGNRR
jgi:hypothetical protein